MAARTIIVARGLKRFEHAATWDWAWANSPLSGPAFEPCSSTVDASLPPSSMVQVDSRVVVMPAREMEPEVACKRGSAAAVPMH